jgi:hypothetical protein
MKIRQGYVIKEDMMDGTCRTDGSDEKYVYSLSENVNETEIFGESWADGRIIVKRILKDYFVSVWTAVIWLRIQSSGGLLWTQ